MAVSHQPENEALPSHAAEPVRGPGTHQVHRAPSGADENHAPEGLQGAEAERARAVGVCGMGAFYAGTIYKPDPFLYSRLPTFPLYVT